MSTINNLLAKQRLPYRPNILHSRHSQHRHHRRALPLPALAALIMGVPFIVQLTVVCALVACVGGFIGNALGGAAAVHDLGLSTPVHEPTHDTFQGRKTP